MNEYEPWNELGMTELEYWKAKYIEFRKELFQRDEAIKVMREALVEIRCTGCTDLCRLWIGRRPCRCHVYEATEALAQAEQILGDKHE